MPFNPYAQAGYISYGYGSTVYPYAPATQLPAQMYPQFFILTQVPPMPAQPMMVQPAAPQQPQPLPPVAPALPTPPPFAAASIYPSAYQPLVPAVCLDVDRQGVPPYLGHHTIVKILMMMMIKGKIYQALGPADSKKKKKCKKRSDMNS